jgi:diguanylate cyclase (GGDEF)-like protein
MLQLDGYSIQDMIYESGHSQVFRARRERDGLPVVIKVPSSPHFSVRENLRYQNEYNLLAALQLSRIIKVHNLVQYRSGFAIIEEDYGACDLNQWLNKKTLAPSEFFTVAIQMAEGLVQMHEQGVIHKDINPANILIHPGTAEVKLTDFGLSTLIGVETQEACAPDLIEGTLSYVSPEQTGRMNRAIDYRTDLYSLGVCYYQMLLGSPPFVTANSLEMVHCHIARSPVSPAVQNAMIPPGLSDLVMKLLEKKAEDRYQSAYGAMQDLLALQAAMRSGELLPKLELGRNDVSSRFQVAHRLYGREQETRQLLEAFDRIATGRSELLLVGGYSGIGKTSLVNEVQKSLVRQRGYFIAGKHDQFQRDIPFSALIQAFRRLVSQILTEREAQIQHWRAALIAALGSNAQVIIDVIPHVEWIVGPQPPVPELGATEAQNRFSRSFQQFIAVFARAEHPLVVFLDDLQWADAPSLALMGLLCANPDSCNLLMIGAYRDNEVSPSHPLTLTLNRIRDEGAPVQTILLGPLSPPDLNRMTADTLHQPPENTQDLSRLLLQKTGGNPFFVTQFLKEINDQGWFTLDPMNGRWQWDMAQIEAAGMTDNVVDLMTGKISRMSQPTQQALKMAACIGNRFELALLAEIQNRSEIMTGSDLWEAIQDGLVLTANTEFRFLHDRVQQAAYSLIAEADIGLLHLNIGRKLWHRAGQGVLDERIFDIAGHLNAAMILINDPDERFQCSLLNLQAGRKAKSSTAYGSALQHFQAASDLLAADCWSAHYRHTLEIYRERADAAYLLGRFAEAEADLDSALIHAADRYDRAAIYLQKIVQYNQLGKYNDLVEIARTALCLFGVTLPDPDDEVGLQADFERQITEYSRSLNQRSIADLVELDEVIDRDQDSIIRLMAILTDGTYIALPSLFPHVVMEVVNLSMRYGHNAMSAIGFAWATVIIVRQFGNYQDAYALGALAMRLNELYPNPRIRAQVTFLYAVCALHWVRPLESQIEVYQQAYQYGIENGNLVFAGYARTMIPKTTLAALTVGKALEECAISLGFYAKSGSPFLMSERFCQIFLRRLQGEGSNPTSLSTSEIDENAWLEHWQQPETLFGHGLAYFLNFKLQLLYLFGQWRAAWEFANNHAEWMKYIPILYETTVFTFYRALAGVSIYEQADGAEQAVIARTLDEAIAEFTLWTANCPNNFAWQEQLLRAEQARIGQRPKEALTGYGYAVTLARQYHRSSGQALSQERAGRLHLRLDQRKRAKPELEEAVFHYYQWGATGKAQALNHEFAALLSSTTLARPVSTSPSLQDTTAISTHRLDLDTVLKASLALSSEILIDGLLQKLMAIFIENAGAERGYLLLPGAEHWVIAAQASVLDQHTQLERIPLEVATTVCEAVIRYVIRTRQSLTLDDACQDSAFGRDPYVQRQGVRSVLCLPLLAQNHLKGVLYLENNRLAGAFVPSRTEILNMLSAQAAIAIENAQLYENLERQVAERTRELSEANQRLQQLSECDGLTGIANRRKFDTVWKMEWQRASRQGLPLAVAMIDVDYFKAYNDHYGHQAGDDCLRQIAEALATTVLRANDLVARYGGEEFVVILPGLTAQQALQVAQRLGAAVADCSIPHEKNSAAPVVTVSIGVAWQIPELDALSAGLLLEADALLYQAKHLGRNRVVSKPDSVADRLPSLANLPKG